MLVSQLGARNVHRYTAINMLAAEVPASAIDTLASHPLVAEIGLIEKQFAQLKYSVPALGAPVFWSAGYTGVGESVAVLDTGVRTSHPAFAGLNIVNKVFLDWSKQHDPCFADDASSPEDFQGHGTHVAGIVASRGAPGWPDYFGVAPGLGTLYNIKIGHRGIWDEKSGQCLPAGGDPYGVPAALEWLVQQAPWVKVINYSYGGDVDLDDATDARMFDWFADRYGLTISIAAGNESWSLLGLLTYSGKLGSPGIGYNTLCVGAMNTQRTVDRNDDTVASFSSRGPTIGGRKKPDLMAPGAYGDLLGLPVGGICSASYAYDQQDDTSDDFVCWHGTSMAAPHIAGSAALLRQAGVRDPLEIKALLLNTTDQLYWDKDHGWGYANLGRAFEQRRNVTIGNLASELVRLYKGTAAGLFYSTLTWNRWVYSYDTASGWCLSNLDLSIYDGSSGTLLARSDSERDNVEKASANLSGPVVVNITNWGAAGSEGGDCSAVERFGLAFSTHIEPATGAVLDASCTTPGTVLTGAHFTMSCTIANHGDLPAFSVKGTLGFTGSTGTAQDFGTIPPGESATRSWTVTAPGTVGSSTLELALQSDSFGARFSGSTTVTFSTASGTCSVALSPTSIDMPASGGNGSIGITAPAGCSTPPLEAARLRSEVRLL